MRYLLAILALIAGPSIAGTIYIQDGQIVQVQTALEQAAPPHTHAIPFDHASERGRLVIEGLASYWNAHSTDGTNLYRLGVVVDVPTVPSPLLANGERIDVDWPLLTEHPATNEIPAQGLTYRLDEGGVVTWWIARRSDLLATQLSAHNAAGEEITRTVNLRTGVDSTINLRKLSKATKFKDLQDAAETKTNKLKKARQ